MDEKQVDVVFTLGEVNEMLTHLGEFPAKYSLELIAFLRNKAQAAVTAANKEVPAEE
jgi:hypothetical protein